MAERVLQPGGPGEPPPEVSVVSPLRTAAGTSVTAALTITNRASQPRVLSVSVLGLDADWLPRPTRSNPIPPGATVTADLVISPSLGTVPARYPLAVAVQALDPGEGKPMSPAQLVDMEMIVDAPGQIDFDVAPVEARSAFGKRLQIAIRNRGSDVAPVLLEAQASEALRIALPTAEQTIGPGETLKLRGRVRVRPRLFGSPVRHAYTVTARSYGAPQHVEASMTTRAVLGPTMLKVTAILAFVSLWATLGVIFIPRLADFARNQAAARLSPQTASASSPATPGKGGKGSGGNGHSTNGGGSGSGGSGNGGSGSGGSGNGGSGSGGSGNGGSGNGGSGNGGSGSGGSGSGGSGNGGSGNGGSGSAGQTPGTVQINGTVAAGQSPSGVNVSIRPTPLVAEDTVQAKQLPSTATLTSAPLGKIPSWALSTTPPSIVSPAQSLPTRADGAWSFAVHNPAYYLLTFSKPGYETQRYVVDSSTVQSTQPLKVHLAPGQGHLDGVVHGPGGGVVGGAKVTITDGTNTITTSSDSKGAVGHWSVDGLSTPSDYLVTISHDGLSTESKLVPLPAGGTQSLVLTLRQGVASLIGRVKGKDAQSTVVGLGGVQITLTDGTVTRSTTTITKAAPGTAAPVGAFHLPGLAPGDYTATIQAPGYLDQTQRITVKRGASSVTMNAVLLSSSGVVWGHVKGEVIGNDGNPVPGSGGNQIQAEVDAGLTLTSPTNIYKITTTAGGLYMFNGVTPGTYVVSAQYAGLEPGFRTVTVGATGTARAEFTLRQAKVVNDAVISGFVGDATNPSNTITCQRSPTCEIDFSLTDAAGQPVGVTPSVISPPASFGATNYTLAATSAGGFAPGLYRLKIKATKYLTAQVNVQVPEHGVGRAPTVNLTVADTVTGAVSFNGDLNTDSSGTTYTNCIVAVPITFIGAVPRDCKPPTTNTCADSGIPDIGVGVIAGLQHDITTDPPTGSYEVSGLCDASYTLYVIVNNTDYVGGGTINAVPPVVVPLSRGIPFPYSPHVYRKGVITMTLDTPDPKSGVVQLLKDTAATVNCSTGAGPIAHIGPLSLKTDTRGNVTVGGLDVGQWGCSATATLTKTVTNPDGTTSTITTEVTGTTAPFFTDRDSTTSQEVTLTAAVGALTGQVTTGWQGGTTPAGVVASVTVTGVTSYSGGQPRTSQATVTTDNKGCFIILPSDTSTATPPAGSPCAGDTTIGKATLGLVTNTGSIQVSATNFKNQTANFDLSAGSFVGISLTPAPVPIAGTLTVDPPPQLSDPAVNVSGASIQVVQQPPGSGSVNVSVSPNTPTVTSTSAASLVWNDSSVGTPNMAQPGTYKLQVSLAGYAPATATVQCTTLGQQCNFGPITLQKLASLTINTVTTVTQLGVTTTQPVPDAAVTLRTGSTSLGTQTPTPGDNSVTFTGLTPGTTYVAHIQAAGYKFGDAGDPNASSLITLDCGTTITITPGSTTTCVATLTPLGAISGTIKGILGTNASAPANVLGNATVTGQHCSGQDQSTGATACSSVNGPVITTVSQSDGSYRISGTTSVEGLQAGWWRVTAGAPGYHSCAAGGPGCPTYVDVTQADITSHSDTNSDVLLYANLVNMKIQVLDSTGKAITQGLTFSVTDLADPTNQPTVFKTPKQPQCAPADCNYWDFGQVIPTSYSVTISGSSIPTINTTISLSVNVSVQRLTIQANASTGSVSGTVSAQQGALLASTGLNGVTLSLGQFTPAHDPTGTFQVAKAAGGTTDLTTTTPTDGTTAGFLSFTGVPLASYDIKVTPPTGYYLASTTAPQVKVTTAGSLVPVAINLQRVTRNVTVQVSTSSSNDDISGAGVTLTPTSPTDNPTFSGFSLSAKKNAPFTTAAINGVPFGTYQVSISLPLDRFGTFTNDALTCTTTATARLCTGSLVVPNTVADSQTALSAAYTLNEFKIGFRVTATALASDVTRAAPSSVALTVTNSAPNGATVYTDSGFAVGSTGSTFIWVPDDATTSPKYNVTATPKASDFPAWPPATVQLDSTASNDTGVVALQEVGATVSVKVTDNAKDLDSTTTASVTLTAPTGQSITWTEPAHTATGDGTASGDVITNPFSDVPFASGWTVTATIGSGSTQRTGTATLNVPADCGTPDNHGVPTCNVTVDVP